MTNRRKFISAVSAALVSIPRFSQAGEPAKVYRLGVLRPTARPQSPLEFQSNVFVSELGQLGWVDGQNLRIEARFAHGKLERLPSMALELVRLRCDVIIAVGSPATRAAQAASRTIPIVMFGNFDPVAVGLVASLARPGGNTTGVLIAPEGTLAGKKLELLKEAVPRATRIAFLAPDDPNISPQVEETRKAAVALGVDLVVVYVRGGDYGRAFDTMVAERCGALFVGAHTYFVRDRKPIIELAKRYRQAAIWEWPDQVLDGGLMAFGASLSGLRQRVAAYVDRIFKGAKPADLPVEQPTRFELVVNIGTAKAMGLTIPQSLLSRADRVIE